MAAVLGAGFVVNNCAGVGAGAPAASATFQLTQWTTEQGLTQNSVKAIAQTPDGYLWIGTLQGLARFDGVRFITYTRGNTPGLGDDCVNALAVDATGTLWVGTRDGLVEWRNGVVKRWTKTDGLPGKDRQEIYQLFLCPAGGVWWREGIHAGRLNEGRLTTYGTEHSLMTNDVWWIAPARGGVLALTAAGVQRLDLERGRFGEPIPLPEKGLSWKVWEDSSGQLFVSGSIGTFQRESNRWVSLPASSGFGAKAKVLEDNAGGCWMASGPEGLRCWRAGQLSSFPIGHEPDQKGVSALCEDREGNLWVGCEGLYRLRPRRIKTWTTLDGLPANGVKSVCAGPDGSVWAGTEHGLARIRDGRVKSFDEPATNFPNNLVWADRTGTIWTAKHGSCVLRYQSNQFVAVARADLPSSFLNAFYEDRAGHLWIGCNREVFVHQDGRFQRRFDQAALGGTPVIAICEDRSGAMWFGTKGGGLKRFSEGKFTTFSITNGLSDNLVTTFHEDADGAMWIGTANGLNRFKDGHMAVFRTSEGLAEAEVHHILEDDFGNFWISGLHGIHRVSRAQLNAVAEGRTNRVECLTYGEADGMASAETNGELQPAGCKTPDGHLWFPTTKGVAEIDPRLLIESEVVPPVVIEEVKADGMEVRNQKAEDRSLKLAAGTARVLEIRYTANSLSAPEKVRFKWKLEPRDVEWHDAGGQRFVFLQNLRPGSYTFRVQACNQHGLWNETGAGLAFVLAPQFHETWMFYALCAGGSAGCAARRARSCRRRAGRRAGR